MPLLLLPIVGSHSPARLGVLSSPGEEAEETLAVPLLLPPCRPSRSTPTREDRFISDLLVAKQKMCMAGFSWYIEVDE